MLRTCPRWSPGLPTTGSGQGATFSPSGVLKVEAEGSGLIDKARGVLLTVRAEG